MPSAFPRALLRTAPAGLVFGLALPLGRDRGLDVLRLLRAAVGLPVEVEPLLLLASGVLGYGEGGWPGAPGGPSPSRPRTGGLGSWCGRG
ncbi:MAG: hypothetical protein ACREX8_10730, partial [Gammaproteobacteria bacterium]